MVDRDEADRAWFAPKRYGYGAGLPIRWQGWVVLAIAGISFLLTAVRLHGMARIFCEAGIVAVLLITCAVKTRGGWRWRWGERG